MQQCAPRRQTVGLAGLPIAFAAMLILAVSCAKPAPSIQPSDLIQIDELAAILADSTAGRLALVHVGFEPLYRSGHIPGSTYVGAGSKPEGLAGLKQYLGALPAEQPVVLYCGCCPWTDCPNVRPALKVAKEMGRNRIRVLYITGNLERDWVAKGLPIVKGDQ
jgi:hypothetical protein